MFSCLVSSFVFFCSFLNAQQTALTTKKVTPNNFVTSSALNKGAMTAKTNEIVAEEEKKEEKKEFFILSPASMGDASSKCEAKGGKIAALNQQDYAHLVDFLKQTIFVGKLQFASVGTVDGNGHGVYMDVTLKPEDSTLASLEGVTSKMAVLCYEPADSRIAEVEEESIITDEKTNLFMIKHPVSWRAAEAACNAQKGTIAQIDSLNRLDAVRLIEKNHEADNRARIRSYNGDTHGGFYGVQMSVQMYFSKVRNVFVEGIDQYEVLLPVICEPFQNTRNKREIYFERLGVYSENDSVVYSEESDVFLVTHRTSRNASEEICHNYGGTLAQITGLNRVHAVDLLTSNAGFNVSAFVYSFEGDSMGGFGICMELGETARDVRARDVSNDKEHHYVLCQLVKT